MIEIAGAHRNDLLELTWSETGGPKISEVPQLDGFGSKMISQIISDELNGSIAYDWQERGLVVTITASLDRLPT